MSRLCGDRLAGAALVAVALAAAFHARTFTVAFLTDPVGPRAIPWVAAALLAVGGALIAVRPGPEPIWPAPHRQRRIGLAVVTFLAYALLLHALGFFVTTTLAVAALAVLFGGRPLRSLLAAAGFAAALYVVFVYGFALSLPAGRLVGFVSG